jgi:hypothetical protein
MAEECAAICLPRLNLGAKMLKFVESEAGYSWFGSGKDPF